MVAAVGGLLMCGARSPVVLLVVTFAIAWLLSRLSLKMGFVGVLLISGGMWVAANNERFQRASSLQDTEMVGTRIAGSANASFLELLFAYPMGAGMGSAVGDSMPFFLAEVAPIPIGLENEYSRILIDQGWFGLVGWLAFLAWLYARPPSAQSRSTWWLGVVLMYSLTLTCWLTAFLGTGILTSIPGTLLLLTQMGVLCVVRMQGGVREAVGPGVPSEGTSFSSPLPPCGEGPGSEGAITPRPVGGIGSGHLPPQPSRGTSKGNGIPTSIKLCRDHLGKPSPLELGATPGVRR